MAHHMYLYMIYTENLVYVPHASAVVKRLHGADQRLVACLA